MTLTFSSSHSSPYPSCAKMPMNAIFFPVTLEEFINNLTSVEAKAMEIQKWPRAVHTLPFEEVVKPKLCGLTSG